MRAVCCVELRHECSHPWLQHNRPRSYFPRQPCRWPTPASVGDPETFMAECTNGRNTYLGLHILALFIRGLNLSLCGRGLAGAWLSTEPWRTAWYAARSRALQSVPLSAVMVRKQQGRREIVFERGMGGGLAGLAGGWVWIGAWAVKGKRKLGVPEVLYNVIYVLYICFVTLALITLWTYERRCIFASKTIIHSIC